MVLAAMKMLLVSVMCFFCQAEVLAQKENNTWYFGNSAGIDFNVSPPNPLTNSAMNAFEGCATASNSKGELLFYTDGVTIWNKNHKVMSNGNGLLGNYSSSQSGVIVRMPKSNTRYYVFTVTNEANTDGMSYSIVDMSMQSGLGSVLSSAKNVGVVSPVCEKITVVKHHNNVDLWIITRLYNSNEYRCYLLTSSGLNTSFVSTRIGSNAFGSKLVSLGYLKSSQDGTKIASINYAMDEIGVFDFDRKSGKLSNPISLETRVTNTLYGGEFSPSGNLLYVSEALGQGRIFQFNLKAGSESKIQNSLTVIGKTGFNTGAIQLAPDRRLYISKHDLYLAVIQEPDSVGTACKFDANGFYLGGKRGSYGLPTFYGSVFQSFSFTDLCEKDSTDFSLMTAYVDSVKWNFGDVASGKANTSSLMNPKHQFTGKGTYIVSVFIFSDTRIDSLHQDVTILPVPKLNWANDTFICDGDSMMLSAAQLPGPYLWTNGSTDPYIMVKETGKYAVSVKTNTCVVLDTVNVVTRPKPEIYLGADTAICFGDSLLLNAVIPNGNYRWMDNSTQPIYMVRTPGKYSVQVEVDGCRSADTIEISNIDLPRIELGPDKVVCDSNFAVLSTNQKFDGYLWSDGSTADSMLIDYSGKYWVTVTQSKCSNADTVNVVFDSTPVLNLPEDLMLCYSESVWLNAKFENANYLWSDGSTDSSLQVFTDGLFWVKVSNQCGEVADSTKVELSDCYCYVQLPNVFTPNADALNEVFQPVTQGCEFNNYNFTIYNRWGEKLFETTNPNVAWTGVYQKKLVPNGVYVYQLQYITQERIRFHKYGTVTVFGR